MSFIYDESVYIVEYSVFMMDDGNVFEVFLKKRVLLIDDWLFDDVCSLLFLILVLWEKFWISVFFIFYFIMILVDYIIFVGLFVFLFL